jgi:hypothetical protein
MLGVCAAFARFRRIGRWVLDSTFTSHHVMASNHLEDLLAEWCEYRGYFVRRNVNVGKRAAGGYECELDVVAFHPTEGRLLHFEPSLDADSWTEREARFTRKFAAGKKYIPKLFGGMSLPTKVEQYAVLVFASRGARAEIGGGTLLMADELIEEILADLTTKHLAKAAVPEQFPLIRTLQYVAHYRDAAVRALTA